MNQPDEYINGPWSEDESPDPWEEDEHLEWITSSIKGDSRLDRRHWQEELIRRDDCLSVRRLG